ncbi:MAG TPA: hypothetical protein VID30_08695 [Bradyrhizobium sp.]|jgi:hypothetical protein
MSSQVQLDFNLFEFVITPKRSRWEWTVRDRSGKALMQGREKSRAAARYQSGRALFLLLLSSCRCCEARR